MRIPWIFLIASIILLSGCAAIEGNVFSGYAAPPLDRQSMQPAGDLLEALRKKDPATLPNGKIDEVGVVPDLCFAVPVIATDAIACKAARNQAVAILVMSVDTLCVQHRKSIYGRDAGTNIVLGTLTNLFAGGAAVAKSAGAKSIYAALALFSNSERSLVNETVYKTMIVTAVDQKLVETMNTKGEALKHRLKDPVDIYSLPEAVLDVVELHNSCSFMNGLRLALSEGTQGSKAKKILTLRQTLNSIRFPMDEACKTPDADSVTCKLTTERFKAVSTSLQTLEAATD